MRSEFIYSVGNIFGKVLEEDHLSKYYIGPYQRGYKWDSRSPYDQVPQLLVDVYNAWQKSKSDGGDQEYYLQYITVLKNKDLNAYEVIDGQQRLTTLAIIFHCIHQKNSDIPSIAYGKIDYARDENAVTLFEKIKLNDPDASQEASYITGACKCINDFLDVLNDHTTKQNDAMKGYADFLLNNVKIILNRENEFVKPEEVFVNLNGNNVELTNAYLIKGLFLTRSICRSDTHGNTYSYHNIQDQRKINGRLWDEIQNWVQQRDVAYYFFGKEGADKGMESLLTLILAPESVNKDSSSVIESFKNKFKKSGQSEKLNDGYRLFNRFNELVQSDHDGIVWMKRLIHAYQKLRTFYEDNRIYNLLGYVLFQPGIKRFAILKQQIESSIRRANHQLAQAALNVLPDISKQTINYKNEKDEKDKRLTPLILSFSVFPEGYDMDQMTPPRFDFPSYDTNQWSIEHIRPQNPPESGKLTLKDFTREPVIEMYEKHIEKERLAKLKEIVAKHIPSQQQIEDIDKQLLYSETRKAIEDGEIHDFDSLPFLYPDIENIDAMGNMALLSREVNSSLSNNPFIVKRSEILKKKNEGYFIPLHTLQVFNKAMDLQNVKAVFSSEQNLWNDKDIATHAEWMRRRNAEIITLLNSLIIKDK